MVVPFVDRQMRDCLIFVLYRRSLLYHLTIAGLYVRLRTVSMRRTPLCAVEGCGGTESARLPHNTVLERGCLKDALVEEAQAKAVRSRRQRCCRGLPQAQCWFHICRSGFKCRWCGGHRCMAQPEPSPRPPPRQGSLCVYSQQVLMII